MKLYYFSNDVQLMLNDVQLMLNDVQLMLKDVQLMLNDVQLMLKDVQLMCVSVRIRPTQSSCAGAGTELGNMETLRDENGNIEKF